MVMRRWDKKAAQRPDIFFANSVTTQERITEYYNRESTVVYPFLTPRELFWHDWKREFFMCLGRAVPYKRFDIAIEACNSLKIPLKIFTSTHSTMTDKLQKISWPTIEWIFDASDEDVSRAFEGAKWFIMPQEEDFGIVALEAMAHGAPVIAYGEGGATETVIHGQTGLLFSEQSPVSLAIALERAWQIDWQYDFIREHGMSFSEERFEEGIREVVWL